MDSFYVRNRRDRFYLSNIFNLIYRKETSKKENTRDEEEK